MPLPAVLPALVSAFRLLGFGAAAAKTAAAAAVPVAKASVAAGLGVEAAATVAAAAHAANAGVKVGAKVGAVATSIAAKKAPKVAPGLMQQFKDMSLGGKIFAGSHVLGAMVVTPLFAYDMIKVRFEKDPEFAQQVANGNESAINELAQMMQSASQNGRGNTREQYNAIKGQEQVNTIESYLGANAPGAPKGVLGNRNDLQHLIQGHQNMLDKVGHQEPMSMLEAYAKQGIFPEQGSM